VARQGIGMTLPIVLAVMTMEPHGGVADQMTGLALDLPRYGVRPIVLVRNPLAPDHAYAALLRHNGIALRAVSHRCYRAIRRAARTLLWLAVPAIVLDATLRGKTVPASRQSLWGVLRRFGYAGLDALFWLRLARARWVDRARLVHFRKPDCWRAIIWASQLRFRTLYTEDAVPVPDTCHYYEGLARTLSHLDGVTAVSEASAVSIGAYCGGRRIRVIPNMVDGPLSYVVPHQAPQEEFVVASLARLAPEKDLITLLSAAGIAATQHPQLRFVIHGDGPQRGELQDRARSLGLEDVVVFAGAFARADLAKIMAGIDLVVLSSNYEGFGVVLVEGMAYGKPVVATAVGGVPEVVADGVTGFLVPPACPERMAEAILRLASDNDLYARMAQAARQRYLGLYTPEKVVPQVLAVYEEVLGLPAGALSRDPDRGKES